MNEKSLDCELEPRRCAGWWRTSVCALALLASCQSYEERPLESAVHRDAWHGRTLEDSSLTSFLDRLAAADGQDAEFNVHDGLSLREAQLVAFVFSPELRIERLRASSAASSSAYAGYWSDPQFSLSVLRVSENVPDRWILNPALTFKIPLSGSLAAEERVADLMSLAAEQSVVEAQWRVRYQVNQAWLEWTAAKLDAEETERFVESMSGLVSTTAQLAERGELLRTEAALFRVEQVQRMNQLRRMRGEVASAEHRLRAQLGLAPEAPVEFQPSIDVAASLPEGADYSAEIAARNPGLAHLRSEYDVAEATLRREIRKQYPDLTIGPQYESDLGQSRLGLTGGLPIPIWNANRRAIEEARLARELARAAYETEYESIAGRYAAESARRRALAAQQSEAEEVLAPLVERQLKDALELMRLGEGSSLVLLESLSRAYQVKLDLIDVRREAALGQATLEHLIGPQLAAPPAANTDESR